MTKLMMMTKGELIKKVQRLEVLFEAARRELGFVESQICDKKSEKKELRADNQRLRAIINELREKYEPNSIKVL